MKKSFLVAFALSIASVTTSSAAIVDIVPRDPTQFSVVCITQDGYFHSLYNSGHTPVVNEEFLKRGPSQIRGGTIYKITGGKVLRSSPSGGFPEEYFGDIKAVSNGQFIVPGKSTHSSSYVGDHKSLGDFGTLMFDFTYDEAFNDSSQPAIGTLVDADALSISVIGVKCSRLKKD